MTKYLTYDKYIEYGGSLEEATFNDLAFEAQSIIDWYTFNRLQIEQESSIPENVMMLMYRLINLLRDKQLASAIPLESGGTSTGVQAGITSQSNDGVSISYNVLSATEIANNAKEEMGILVNRYLQGITNSLGRKLLYRGFYPDE